PTGSAAASATGAATTMCRCATARSRSTEKWSSSAARSSIRECAFSAKHVRGGSMRSLVFAAAMAASVAVQAADKVKIGFISKLSGPNASIGTDIRDGFNLAIKLNGGKLGGLPAEVLVGDDQLKPELAKQFAERFLRLEKVDFITGIVFSNIVVAVAPDAIASKVFFISPNAGPAQYTGAQCDPFFFAASWPSEAYSEAAGQYVTSKGINNVIFLAPNYVGGQDAATGFKRYYKGKLADELYTKLGQ